MAQLRDAVTSELVAEGTVEELVLIAQHIEEDVIYDDVGENFNPDEVLKAYLDNLDGLKGSLKAQGTPGHLKAKIEDAVSEAEGKQPDASVIEEVQANIQEARKDVEGQD